MDVRVVAIPKPAPAGLIYQPICDLAKTELSQAYLIGQCVSDGEGKRGVD